MRKEKPQGVTAASVTTHLARSSSCNRIVNISWTLQALSSFIWRSLICCCWSSNSFSNSWIWLRGSSAEIKSTKFFANVSFQQRKLPTPNLFKKDANLGSGIVLFSPGQIPLPYHPWFKNYSMLPTLQAANSFNILHPWPRFLLEPVRRGGAAVCIFSLCSLHFLFGLAVMTLIGEKNKECCVSVIYHKINAMSDLNAVRKKKKGFW